MREHAKPARLRHVAASVLCLALLAACGGSPESMVASAKEFMAKNDRNAASIQLKNALQKNPNNAEARFLLGKVSFEQNDYPGAEKELRRALDGGYPVDETVPLLAWALLYTGQASKVTGELAEQKLFSKKAQAEFLSIQGFAWQAQGRTTEAVKAFRSALEFVPEFPLALVGQARLKALDKDLEGALADVDGILKKAPTLPEANGLRGDLLLALNRPDEAIKAFEAVIAARPTEFSAHQNLVSTLLRLNKIEEAQAKLVEMRKALGNNALVHYIQGYIHVRNGKSKEGYEEIQLALRGAPDYIPALLMAATLQIQLKDFSQAETNLGKILSKAPNLAIARRLMTATYLGQREPAKALEVLQPLLKDQGNDVEILNLAGQVHAMNGDFAKSQEYFAKAAAGAPKDAQLRTRLGASRLASGEVERAFQDLEAASALDPDNIQADVTLIMAHLRRGETAKAMAAVKVLEAKKPNDPITLNMKGGVLLASKDLAGARKAFESALEVKPDYLPSLTNLARLDIAEKQFENARKRFEAFVTKNPNNSQAYLSYAEFVAMTGGQPTEVKGLLERGLAASPNSFPVRSALIRLLVQSGDAKRALLLSQEAAAATPDDPAVLELLGRAQVAAGELQQALTTFGKLSTRLPSSFMPLVAMADVQVASKDFTSAEQSLRKALVLKPDSIETQQRLIAVLINTVRYDAAANIARDIQKQHKTSPVGFNLEAEVLAVAGKKNEAVAAFEEAYRLDQKAPALIRLHRARVIAGQNAEAAKLLADWFKANPKDLIVRTYLAERNLVDNKLEQAIEQYKQMLEIAPKNAMILNNLAWTMGKLKQKGAIEVAQQAVALAPNSAVVLDTLGTLLVESGQVDKGVETLKRAVSLLPNLPQLHFSLAKGYIAAGNKDGARAELEIAIKNAPEKSSMREEVEKLRRSL